MSTLGNTPGGPPDQRATPRSDPAHAGDLGFDLPKPTHVTRGRALTIGAVAVVVLVAVVLAAWLPKRRAERDLAASAKGAETAKRRVQVIAPKIKSSDRTMTLPASVHAREETVVYPRSSGYVTKWHVDIGDGVAEGALLAEIDQPEIDQQLAQARAQLVQARAGLVQATANSTYSMSTLDRWKQLTPKGVASEQELDQKRAQSAVDEASVKVARAGIEAQEANVRRLSQMKSWGRVTAPFAGTVNARMVERGALVSATTPLFRISATDPVRVLVQVPQEVAPSVRSDVPAKVTVREYPGRAFDGIVARSAGAIDPTARTMNTEIRVPNPKGELLPGMYAQVAMTLPSPHRVFEVPATAVMSDAKGLRVAVVHPDDTIHFVNVVAERDTGATMELSTGISEDDRIVKLAGADLVEGQPVDVAP